MAAKATRTQKARARTLANGAKPAAPERPFGDPVPARRDAPPTMPPSAPARDPVEAAMAPPADEQLAAIVAAEREVARAERASLEAREQAKELHKVFESAQAKLRRVIVGQTEELPLFDRETGEIQVSEDED